MQAASKGESPCATKPAIKPVSTSPVPPLASPELPVLFIANRPSGLLISVRAPLSTRVTPYSWLKDWARASRSFCTSAALRFNNRPISPGCGVRITAALALARTSKLSTSPLIPSASSTIGQGLLSTSFSTTWTVSSWTEIPGPRARACLSSSSICSLGKAADATV